jgi:CRISPR-associated protein Csd1
MILQALTRYYEILEEDGKLPKPGYADAKVSFALNLSEAGKLLEILPLKHEEKRGKKTVELPQMKVVPEPVTRSVDISANFLCDNSTYFLGLDKKGKPETLAQMLCRQPGTAYKNFEGCAQSGGSSRARFFPNMGPAQCRSKHRVPGA